MKQILAVIIVVLLGHTSLQAQLVSLDVVFLMDSSGSIGATGWNNEKSFASSFVETGLISEARVGVIRFAQPSFTEYEFDDDQTRSSIMGVIDGLAYLDGFTYMSEAFQKSIDLFNSQSTPATPKAVILLTDGTYSSGHNPISLKPTLDSLGIEVFVVGFGDNWDPGLVDGMVNDPANIVDASAVGGSFVSRLNDLASPVPEPSSSTLSFVSLALIGWQRRRKRAA